MMSKCGIAIAIAIALTVSAGRARADDPVDDDPHYAVAAAESLVLLWAPAAYYEATTAQQKVDFTNPSWTDKLTLQAFRFDTNPFYTNAIRHPLTGVLDYQIARSNGFGPVRSALFAYLAALVWEIGIEYRENPSINDVMMNGVGGIAIGEPLFEIGQVWRSESPSLFDRARTALASPFDAIHDTWRTHRWRKRPVAADFVVSAGGAVHDFGGPWRSEVIAGIDFDIVRHAHLDEHGAHSEDIEPGAWSRFLMDFTFPENGTRFSSRIRSSTSVIGHYDQDDGGHASLITLSSAFLYRRDVLAAETDHVAVGQIAGPALLLVRRGDTTIRFDLAAYADFGMIDAHVFHPISPLPLPPPFRSTLQAEGYYDGAGMSIESRLRADHGPWRADVELSGHRLWSLDFADRDSKSAQRTTSASQIPLAPHGVSDSRIYTHASAGWHGHHWGLAAILETAYRHGSWSDLSRTTSDWRSGLEVTADL